MDNQEKIETKDLQININQDSENNSSVITNQLNSLKHDLDENQSQQNEIVSINEDYQHKLNLALQQNESLAQQVLQLKEESYQQNQKIELNIIEYQTLNKTNEKTNMELNQKYDKVCQDFEQEIQKLQNEKQESLTEIYNLKEQVQQISQDHQKAQEKIQDQTEIIYQIEQQNLQNQNILSINSNLTKEIESLNKLIKDQQLQIDTLNRNLINQLQQEKESFILEKQQLQTQYETYQQELLNEIEALAQLLKKSELEHQQIDASYELSRKEIEILSEKNLELENLNKDLTLQLETFKINQEQIQELNLQLQNQQKNLKEQLMLEVEQKSQDLDLLNKQIQNELQDKLQLQQNNEVLSEKVQELENIVIQLRNQQKIQEEKTQLEYEVLQISLEEAQEKEKESLEQENLIKIKFQELSQKYEILEQEIKQNNQQMNEERQILKEELQYYQNLCEELKNNLDSIKKNHKNELEQLKIQMDEQNKLNYEQERQNIKQQLQIENQQQSEFIQQYQDIHANEIKVLQDEIKRLEVQNQEQKKQLMDQLEKKEKEYQQEVDLLTRQRMEQDEMIQTFQKSQMLLKEKESQIDQLNLQLCVNQEDQYNMEQKYENTLLLQKQKHESQIEDLHRLIQELKQQLETVESEGKMMQNSLNDMEVLDFKCKELKTENDELKQKIQEKQTQIDEFKLKVDFIDDKDEEEQNKDAQIEELKAYIIKQEEDYSEQFEKLGIQIEKSKNQIKELEQENQDQKKIIAQYHTQVHSQQVQLQQVIQQQQNKQSCDSGINQNISNPYVQNQQQSHNQEKTVTIPVKELQNWDKKSKDQLNQIKVLQTELLQLKQLQEEQTKAQNTKQQKTNLSMESLVQKCQALQQIIDDSSVINSKLTSELGWFKQQNSQLKEDLKLCNSELRDLRIISQNKFKLESELQQALNTLSEYQDQQKLIKKLGDENQRLKEEFENTSKQFKQNEKQRIKLQEKYDEVCEELGKVKKQGQNIELELDQKSLKLKDLEKILSTQFQEFSILEQKYNDQNQINDDLRNQLRINQKRYSQEIEQLTQDLMLKQKKLIQLEEQSHIMSKDLQIMRDMQFRQKTVIEAPLTKKEKIVVESLANRVQELEIQNKTMKDQYNSKIISLTNQLEEKIIYIQQLGYNLSKAYPNLSESDIIDKEDRKLIQSLRNKQNIQDILEKTMIENLQLRDQIKLLGAELNKRR
ncbi:unnamed protein product [Paramecium sonneborni]|uniref:Uncharacterized protein n=1 Tax=Paramecium sonneborni TaxID=65129 RepID=A0A8S1LE09_9CILI|nr:unnamed protein product [Paramecium sonneborni]